MSTTTALELLERADLLTRQLRRSGVAMTLAQWETFDATVHRLLLELGGIGYRYARYDDPAGRALRSAVETYPTPLRPPMGERLTPAVAVRYRDCSAEALRWQLRKGQLRSVKVGGIRWIDPQDLDDRPDIRPADPLDEHPLAQVSCTLGAMADLVRQARDAGIDVLGEDGEIAGAALHVLSLTAVTARHTIARGDLAFAVRPVLVGSYAERVIDTLRDVARQPISLGQLTSVSVAPNPKSPNDRFEAALHSWSTAARREVGQAIPSVDSLRQIANRGAHMCEVRAQLDVDGATRAHLHESAVSLARAANAWGSLTTLTRPNHEFVTASRELFETLRAVRDSIANGTPSLDRSAVAEHLDRGLAVIDTFMSITRSLPERLLAANVLRGPARSLDGSIDRLRQHAHGHYVPARPGDAPDLPPDWRAAGESLSEVRGLVASPLVAMQL